MNDDKPNGDKPSTLIVTDSLPPTLEEELEAVEALVDQGDSPGTALQKTRFDLDKVLEDAEASRRLLGLIQEWYLNDTEAEAATRAKLMDILLNGEDPKAQVAAAKELRGWVQKQEQKGAQVGGILAQFFAQG